MSRSAAVAEVGVEIVVEGRSQWSTTVHRPDPEADEPTPACHESVAHDEQGYRRVALELVASHRSLCQNPACFGGEQR